MQKVFKRIHILIIFGFLFLFGANIQAQYKLDAYRFIPQIGIWFGPVAPLPGTQYSDVLKTSFGGGLFVRFNFPTDTWRLEAASSFSYYGSDDTQALISIPTYGAISYFLPIEFPLKFQLKLGMGANHFKNRPERHQNTYPAIFSGFEMYFPAGKYVNMGLRIDYYFIIESHIDLPPENPDLKIVNAHFFNVGISISFNIPSS